MRTEILNKLHVAHQGINSCQRKAKSAYYWPNMSSEIKSLFSLYATFQSRQRANIKQPLATLKRVFGTHEIPRKLHSDNGHLLIVKTFKIIQRIMTLFMSHLHLDIQSEMGWQKG